MTILDREGLQREDDLSNCRDRGIVQGTFYKLQIYADAAVVLRRQPDRPIIVNYGQWRAFLLLVCMCSGSRLESHGWKVTEKNPTSVIWNWFGFSVTDQAQANAICKVCRETVYTSGGNTTNLCNHLKRKTPKQYAESQTARGPAAPAQQAEAAASIKPKQTTLTQAFDKGTP